MHHSAMGIDEIGARRRNGGEQGVILVGPIIAVDETDRPRIIAVGIADGFNNFCRFICHRSRWENAQ